jgi:hypothetical protein
LDCFWYFQKRQMVLLWLLLRLADITAVRRLSEVM